LGVSIGAVVSRSANVTLFRKVDANDANPETNRPHRTVQHKDPKRSLQNRHDLTRKAYFVDIFLCPAAAPDSGWKSGFATHISKPLWRDFTISLRSAASGLRRR
jgi:hypothetical protein